VNTAERAKEIAYRRPHSLNGVGVNFTKPIFIIILSPLIVAVANGYMGMNDVVVTLPLIRVNLGISLGEGMDMVFECL
jgi:hypothetical protein